MTIKSTLRNIAAGTLALVSTAMPSLAGEHIYKPFEPTLDERVVVENGVRPITETLFRYGDSRAVAETRGDKNIYGLNLENKNVKLNLVQREGENSKTDSYRILGGLENEHGWADVSYDSFQKSNLVDSVNARLALKPTKELQNQVAFNDLGTWRSINFYQLDKETRAEVGFGQNKGKERVAEVAYSTRINEDYRINGHLKAGDRAAVNCREARIRFGRNSMFCVNRSIEADFANNTELTENGYWSDPTQPWGVGQFNYLSAESQCGDRTGDVGGDINAVRNGLSYATVAINVGDYGPVQDVMVSPEVHRDLSNNKDGFRMGRSAYLGKSKSFRAWTQASFNEHSKPDFAGYFAYTYNFGGKK